MLLQSLLIVMSWIFEYNAYYEGFINSFVGFGKGFETFDILKLNIKKQEHFNQELLR